jgi:hypothetical protein
MEINSDGIDVTVTLQGFGIVTDQSEADLLQAILV